MSDSCPETEAQQLRAELATARETNRRLNRLNQKLDKRVHEGVNYKHVKRAYWYRDFWKRQYYKTFRDARIADLARERDALKAELKEFAVAAEKLESYLIEKRWQVIDGWMINGFPEIELAAVTKLIDAQRERE